jgi:DNA-binding FadR family transcriptional regulator
VSRTAIREAIKVLTSKGLVEVRRKTGTRLELREIIEPIGAGMAADRATTEEVAEIERTMIEMERSVGKTTASVEADLLFHLAILEATHNSFIRPFGALIQAALRASFLQTNRDAAAYHRHS